MKEQKCHYDKQR